MRFAKVFIIVAVTTLVAFQANAQRAGAAYPPGTKSCGDYLEDRKLPGSDDHYASWTWGFLSAYNFYGTKPQVTGAVSRGTIVAYLDKHCRDKPLSAVITGVSALAEELAAKK